MPFSRSRKKAAKLARLLLLSWEIYRDARTQSSQLNGNRNTNQFREGENLGQSFVQPFSKAYFFQTKARQKLLCYYVVESRDEKEYLKNHALPLPEHSLAEASCPFGDLELNTSLVKNLLHSQMYGHNCSRRTQLGLSLHSSSNMTHNKSNLQDAPTTQIKSLGAPFGAEFYPKALYDITFIPLNEEKLNGITFEFVFRRHSTSKEVLFTIQNEYNPCSGLGFQLQIDEHSTLVLVVKHPSTDSLSECNELRFRSKNSFKKCAAPSIDSASEGVDTRPVIHVIITFHAQSSLNGILYNTHFFIDYMSSTATHYTCDVQDEQLAALNNTSNSMDVTYRLYVGTGPTDEMHQKYHVRGIRPRVYRDPRAIEKGSQRSDGNEENTAILQLRKTLQHILDNIEGPRIPAAARLFGHRAFSLQLLGWKFPAVNEDTPFAWIRGKIKQFKDAHGTQVVDIIVEMLLKAARLKAKLISSTSEKLAEVIGERLGTIGTENTTVENQTFEESNFDLFAFGLYGQILSEEEIKQSMDHLLPTRSSLRAEITVDLPPENWMLVDFSTMSSVFTNICLELLDPLPDTGNLILWPSTTLITTGSGPKHREFIDGRHHSSDQMYFVPVPSQTSRQRIDASILFAQCRTEGIRSVMCDRNEFDFIPTEEDPFQRAINVLRDELQDNLSDTGRLTLEREKRGESIGRINIHLIETLAPLKPIHQELEYEIVAGIPTIVHIRNGTIDVNESKRFEWKRSSLRLRVIEIPQFGTLYDTDSLHVIPGCTPIQLGSEVEFLARWENRRITIAHANGYRGIESVSMQNDSFSTTLLFYFPQAKTAFSAGTKSYDELLYELIDKENAVVERGRVKFHLTSPIIEPEVSICHRESWLQLEDTPSLIYLQSLLPASASTFVEKHLRILSLPQRGRLYQYVRSSNASQVEENPLEQKLDNVTSRCDAILREHVGRQVRVNDTVEDPLSRAIYVPEIDYHNQPSPETTLFASVLYERSIFLPSTLNFTFVAMLSNESKSLSAQSHDCRILIDIQVIDVDDDIIPTSPFHIKGLRGENKTLSFPLRFVDPDEPQGDEGRSYKMLYLIHIVSENLDAEFRFPSHEAVDDDKLYKNCYFRKFCRIPCGPSLPPNDALVRMSNSSIKTTIYFIVQKSTYTPYDVYFVGHLSGIRLALESLQIVDYNQNWSHSHTSEFTVSFTRWKRSFHHLIPYDTRDDESLRVQNALQVIMRSRPNVIARLAVEFETSQAFENETRISEIDFGWYAISSKAQRVLRKILLVFSLLYTAGYVSCCRLCCFFFRGRRMKRTRRLQRKYWKRFDKVVRDDIEYSRLIVQLADVIIASDFIVAKALVRTCVRGSNAAEAQRLTSLCLRNLLPILKAVQRDDDFVLDLLQYEISSNGEINRPESVPMTFEIPGTASIALAIHFQSKASTWIDIVLIDLAVFLDEGEGPPSFHATLMFIFEILHKHLPRMPIRLLLHKAVRIVMESLTKCGLPVDKEYCVYRVAHVLLFNHFFSLYLINWKQYMNKYSSKQKNMKTYQIEYILQSAVRFLHQMALSWPKSESFEPLRDFGSRNKHQRRYSEFMVSTKFSAEELAFLEDSYCSLLKRIASYCETNERDKSSQLMDISNYLMNIHSILDCRWSFFLTECILQAVKRSSLSPMSLTYLQHVEALVRALGIPYASTDELLSTMSYHDPYISPLYGLNVNAWQERLKLPAA